MKMDLQMELPQVERYLHFLPLLVYRVCNLIHGICNVKVVKIGTRGVFIWMLLFGYNTVQDIALNAPANGSLVGLTIKLMSYPIYALILLLVGLLTIQLVFIYFDVTLDCPRAAARVMQRLFSDVSDIQQI